MREHYSIVKYLEQQKKAHQQESPLFLCCGGVCC